MTGRCWFVVPAAGASRRMGGDVPKQYLPLGGCRVIEHALRPLLSSPHLAGGVVVLAPGDPWWAHLPAEVRDRVRTVEGGAERCHSVLNGLAALPASAEDWVLVHDAARPCLSEADLEAVRVAGMADRAGALLAVPLADTLKLADPAGRAERTVPREGLWRALTPQMFQFGILRHALNEALASGSLPTDEAQAVEQLGLRPRLVHGSALNIKITRPDDLAFAAAVLAAWGMT